MPLPKTKDVGKVIRFLNEESPGMSRKQKIAIALSQTSKSDSPKMRHHIAMGESDGDSIKV